MEYVKYAEIRDLKGLKDNQVANISGICRSTFSDWKAGRSTPKVDKLDKIALALGYPDYKCLDNAVNGITLLDKALANLPTPTTMTLTKEEKKLIEKWRNADRQSKLMVLRILSFANQGGDISID